MIPTRSDLPSLLRAIRACGICASHLPPGPRPVLQVHTEVFCDPTTVAIAPMGFCYPGTGRSGDLPPRQEYAPAWRESLLSHLDVRLTLVIGQYAQRWHLAGDTASMTETVANWRENRPSVLPLPHPSPRNRIWVRKNPWFESDVIPALRARITAILLDR